MRVVDYILRQHQIARRTLAVLLVVLALAGAWIGLIAPTHALILSQARWRMEVRQHLASAKGQASAEGALREQLNELPHAPVWSRFYPSSGAESADAALRADLTRLVTAAGVTGQALAPLPMDEEGALMRHGVRIAASMTIDQLQRLVTGLHHDPRYLRVARLTVSAPIVQSPHTNPPVLVKMVVYGYSLTHQGGTR